MNHSGFRARIHSGEFLLGTWVSFIDPAVTEALCGADIDFLILDSEHGPLGPETIHTHVLAAKAGAHSISSGAAEASTPPAPAGILVRVGALEPIRLMQALDAGADGVLVPQIRGPDDVRTAVAWCRYPPAGTRGYGPRRPSRYGRETTAYIQTLDDRITIIVQIERREALDQIEAIVEIPGLDAILVGPNDLSGSLGILGEMENPILLRAIDRITEAAHRSGMPIGIAGAGTAEFVETWRGRGFTFVAAGSDFGFLTAGIDDLVARVRAREAG